MSEPAKTQKQSYESGPMFTFISVIICAAAAVLMVIVGNTVMAVALGLLTVVMIFMLVKALNNE